MSSTGMSLNDRFTVLAGQKQQQQQQRQMLQQQQQQQQRGRSRSRSRQRQNIHISSGNQNQSSSANVRLLNQFKRKHAMRQTALKLKRRSLRTAANGGGALKRIGGIKTLRMAPNGQPIRANSLNRIPTMRADFVSNNGGGNRGSRPLRRNIPAARLGGRRPQLGGAAERIAKRRIQRSGSVPRRGGIAARLQQQQYQPQQQQFRNEHRGRSRSRSRGPQDTRIRARSQSRGRANSRIRNGAPSRPLSREQRVPVKLRLGERPGNSTYIGNSQRQERRGSRGGVVSGRIQKRKDNRNVNIAQKAVGAAGRNGRFRGRSAVRDAIAANASHRSRSRTRRDGAAAGTQDQRQGLGKNQGGINGRRGRSVERRRGAPKNNNNNNNIRNGNKRPNNQKQQQQSQQQPRRGRSRSRGRGVGGRQAGGAKVPGKNTKTTNINKDELDKELDQYMATTKTDMDYLLK